MSFEIGVPNVTFQMRVQTDEAPGFAWEQKTSMDLFKNKKVILIGLPGAFTPTCSSTHLPGFDSMYDKILSHGFDDVYCVSVNDSFTMNAWFKQLNIVNVKPIPDGNADFTRTLGMLVKKENLGFGMRSWRYSAIVNNGMIEHMFVEPGLSDNCQTDPFEVSDVFTMMNHIEQHYS
jgi:peroxiredoxin